MIDLIANNHIKSLSNASAGSGKSPFSLQRFRNHPGEIVLGPLWAGCWAFSAFYAGKRVQDLYNVCSSEGAFAEKMHKIAEAVKKSFVSLMSLGGSTLWMASWSHEMRIISLGRFALLAEKLSYGTTLISSGAESAWGVYSMWREKEAFDNGKTAEEKERRRQQFVIQLLNTAANTTMVVWAALGIAGLAAGLVIAPWASLALLGGSLGLSVASSLYENRIDPANKV